VASDGPVAAITGASSGIGEATALALSRAGYAVALGARRDDRLRTVAERVESEGGQAFVTTCDVADEGQARGFIESARERLGRLDVLVNNAGVSHAGTPGRSLEEIATSGRPSVASLDEVRAVFETNVFGVIAVTQAMLSLLREAPAARVVNVSSGSGSLTLNADPANPHRAMFGAVYSPSKTALNALTLAFAIELESTGIKVNAADPGFTQTDLNNNQGTGTVEEGAREAVRLALLGADGPTGTFSNNNGPVPW
jgi:NAD(P)-dependent dehydrogenase (short-subunit alcohol dehydrogenase family)